MIGKGMGTGEVINRGLLPADDPIFKEGWTVSMMPQSGQKSSTPSRSTPSDGHVDTDECKNATQDEETGDQPAEPSESGTVIDPEDGLFKAMDALKEKLGREKFLDLLMEKFPPKKKN